MNPTTRDRILTSTWNLLESGDPAATRMADIAKAAGISRQALYLHFPNRGELLIATARYLDEVKEVDKRLVASRTATSGGERLDAYIDAWGGYIPEIYGMAKAFWALWDTDPEARAAWQDRMDAVRHGCAAAVDAIAKDKALASGLTKPAATDMLAMLLSVRNWEYLRQERGWSQKRYIQAMKTMARQSIMAD